MCIEDCKRPPWNTTLFTSLFLIPEHHVVCIRKVLWRLHQQIARFEGEDTGIEGEGVGIAGIGMEGEGARIEGEVDPFKAFKLNILKSIISLLGHYLVKKIIFGKSSRRHQSI